MATEKNPLCEEVKDELARVLDGTAASELYDHIAECDACRDPYFSFRASGSSVRWKASRSVLDMMLTVLS